MALIVNSSNISPAYHISYEGTPLKQIDVVQDGSRYTVWRAYNQVLIFDEATSEELCIRQNGTLIFTIPEGTVGDVPLDGLGITVGDTIELCKRTCAVTANVPDVGAGLRRLFRESSYTVTTGLFALRVKQYHHTNVFNITFTGVAGRSASLTRTWVSGDGETDWGGWPGIVAGIGTRMRDSRACTVSVLMENGEESYYEYHDKVSNYSHSHSKTNVSVNGVINESRLYFKGAVGNALVEYDDNYTGTLTYNYVNYEWEEA